MINFFTLHHDILVLPFFVVLFCIYVCNTYFCLSQLIHNYILPLITNITNLMLLEEQYDTFGQAIYY